MNTKNLFIAASVILSSVFATSCQKGSDDQDENVQKQEYKNAEVTVEYEFSEDVLKVFDLTVNVTDFDGNTQSIDVTKAGKQSFTTTSKNGVLKVNYDSKVKAGATVENRAYEFMWKMYLSSDVHYKNGNPDLYTEKIVNTTVNAPAGKLTDATFASFTNRHATSEVYTLTLKDGDFVR